MFLDIGCGDAKPAGFTGMDKRKLEGVDIVHDIRVIPWPIEDEVCDVVICNHVLEHINPECVMDIMNEIWRITKVNGKLFVGLPYAGSDRFWQDPTHIHSWTETTATYFDAEQPMYKIYKPMPWKITHNSRALPFQDLEVIFVKRGISINKVI